jgi:hypothetical protein
MRRHTTNPSSKWVASKSIPILKKTPDMSVREMQIKLQDNQSVSLAMTQFGMEWKRL